jgi:hypothetical protein
MKTAEHWQEELAGETSVQSIRQIQADSLCEGLRLISRCQIDLFELQDCTPPRVRRILLQALQELLQKIPITEEK